ncbi:winged helix domain-containing protein [Streptomyces sp. NPDC008222]|uniref:winged helix domain-containing protein n=1 Tax=Streptomyces sp. NPDC008222 TaxID=3364820 RepID=UPI0036EC5919
MAKLAGGDWPEADEDKLWDLQRAHQDYAKTVREVAAGLGPVIDDVKSGVSGSTSEQFEQYLRQVQSNLGQVADSADGGLRVRLTTARAVLDVGEDTVTLSAAGTVYEFAPEAEAVLRPLADGRTVDLATLADTAGLALEDVAALVQELVAGQAATVGSLL